MKNLLLRKKIFFIISAIVFLASTYLLCSFPSGLILDIFWDKMDAEDMEQLGYNSFLIAGLPAGEGIESLENKEQYDAITLGEHYEFFTFETRSVIPLDAYQLRSGTDTNNNTYRLGRYLKSTGKQWPTFTDDFLKILLKRNIYNRYYLVALPDGNYVVAYLDDAYYLKYLLTRKIKLPVGYVTYMNYNEEELLQPCLEKYGIEEEKVVVMVSQERYENYKGLYKLIPLIVYICVLALYWGVATIVVSVLKKRGSNAG